MRLNSLLVSYQGHRSNFMTSDFYNIKKNIAMEMFPPLFSRALVIFAEEI